MSPIIAARFQTFEQAEGAVQALTDANINREDVSVFYVNPAGQHDTGAATGDSALPEPEALGSQSDVVASIGARGATDAAVSIAAAASPAGSGVVVTAIGVGAFREWFAGNLADASDADIPPHPPRRAGVLVAVRLEENQAPHQASKILSTGGGKDLEMAEGVLRDGAWIDFDPLTPQRFISAPVDL